MMHDFEESLQFIHTKTQLKPRVGIVLGTGLGDLVNRVEVETSLDYSEIPHFPVSTVETHKGRLVFGHLEGITVVVMQGRFHHYEGYSMQEVTYPVRIMKLLGIEKIFISNISGGINPQFELGDLMVIEDHINLQSENPLTGRNIDAFGPRWPDMFEPYDKTMIRLAMTYGKQQGYRIFEGVYASVPGPNLETRAEYRYLAKIGADSVGMSTVPEVLVARHMNIPVFAVSAISDLCYEPKLKPANINELLWAAAEAQPKISALFCYLLKQMEQNSEENKRK